MLRYLPQKRLVCTGFWRGQAVLIKLFLHPRNKRRYCQRDERGVRALIANNILTPALLYVGKSSDNDFDVMVLELIQPAENASVRWDNLKTTQEMIAYLQTFAKVLAEHHTAGLLQSDLHLNNFLFSATNNELHTLDGDGIKCFDKSIGKQKSLSNLGQLFAQLYPRFDRLAQSALLTYVQARQWRIENCGEHELHELQHWIKFHRRRRRKIRFSKIFRSCSAFCCHQNFTRFQVFDRRYDTAPLRLFLDDPMAHIQLHGGTLLTAKGHHTLWRTTVDEHDFVVCHDNIGSLYQRFLSIFTKSRARLSWLNAQRLCLYGIPTPPPVALLERRFGVVTLDALYIYGYVNGSDCQQWFNTNMQASDHQKHQVANQFGQSIQYLTECGISHGKLSASHGVIGADKTYILDLEKLTEHKTHRHWQIAQEHDKHHFENTWSGSRKDLALLLEQI